MHAAFIYTRKEKAWMYETPLSIYFIAVISAAPWWAVLVLQVDIERSLKINKYALNNPFFFFLQHVCETYLFNTLTLTLTHQAWKHKMLSNTFDFIWSNTFKNDMQDVLWDLTDFINVRKFCSFTSPVYVIFRLSFKKSLFTFSVSLHCLLWLIIVLLKLNCSCISSELHSQSLHWLWANASPILNLATSCWARVSLHADISAP